jgi:hypothetical protein
VYGNYLLNTEGIRFFGDGHKIFSNHLVGNSPAIQIGNGDGEVADGDKLTSHDRPDDCEVSFNTLVDNQSNLEMSGRTGGLGATNLLVANNLIQGGGAAASIRGPLVGGGWRGNILWQSSAGDMPGAGFRTVNPRLVKDARGEFRLAAGSPAIDTASGAAPSPALDMDGQTRGADPDVGADELSSAPVIAHLLGESEVGPGAKDDAPGSGGGSKADAGAPADGPGNGLSIAFEAESVAFSDSGTGTTVDADQAASGGRWVSLVAENPGSWMEFITPAIPAGTYALALRWKGNGNRGVATLRLDGAPIGEPLDQFSVDQSYPTTTIATVTFGAADTHVVRMQVSGQNPVSTGFVLSADQFLLTRQ